MKNTDAFGSVLYAGLMITNQGPKVLGNYNVRFGDPEAVVLMVKPVAPRSSWPGQGQLSKAPPLEWDDRPAVCVVMASEGYPGDYEKGRVIRGLDAAAELADTKVFHAGTSLRGEEVVTNGGRVLGVTALGNTVADAKLKAYQAVKRIRWDGAGAGTTSLTKR